MTPLVGAVMLVAGYLLLDLLFATGMQLRGKLTSSLSCFYFNPKFKFTPGPIVDCLLIICFFGGGAGFALARQSWPVWLAGMCGGFVGRTFVTISLLREKVLNHIAQVERM